MNITILFRPGVLYLAGLASLFLLFYLVSIKEFNIKKYTPFILSLVFVGIQFISIYQTYGNVTPSYIDKLTWYYYLGGEAMSKASGTNYMDERKMRKNKVKSLSWSETSTLSKNDLKAQVSNNLDHIFIEYLHNLYENSSSGSTAVIAANKFKSKEQNLIKISYRLYELSKYQNIFFVLLSAVAFVLMLFYRKSINIAMLISFGCVSYIFLTSGISFWQGDRFHIVFYPLVILTILYLGSLNVYAQKWLKPIGDGLE